MATQFPEAGCAFVTWLSGSPVLFERLPLLTVRKTAVVEALLDFASSKALLEMAPCRIFEALSNFLECFIDLLHCKTDETRTGREKLRAWKSAVGEVLTTGHLAKGWYKKRGNWRVSPWPRGCR